MTIPTVLRTIPKTNWMRTTERLVSQMHPRHLCPCFGGFDCMRCCLVVSASSFAVVILVSSLMVFVQEFFIPIPYRCDSQIVGNFGVPQTRYYYLERVVFSNISTMTGVFLVLANYFGTSAMMGRAKLIARIKASFVV